MLWYTLWTTTATASVNVNTVYRHHKRTSHFLRTTTMAESTHEKSQGGRVHTHDNEEKHCGRTLLATLGEWPYGIGKIAIGGLMPASRTKMAAVSVVADVGTVTPAVGVDTPTFTPDCSDSRSVNDTDEESAVPGVGTVDTLGAADVPSDDLHILRRYVFGPGAQNEEVGASEFTIKRDVPTFDDDMRFVEWRTVDVPFSGIIRCNLLIQDAIEKGYAVCKAKGHPIGWATGLVIRERTYTRTDDGSHELVSLFRCDPESGFVADGGRNDTCVCPKASRALHTGTTDGLDVQYRVAPSTGARYKRPRAEPTISTITAFRGCGTPEVEGYETCGGVIRIGAPPCLHQPVADMELEDTYTRMLGTPTRQSVFTPEHLTDPSIGLETPEEMAQFGEWQCDARTSFEPEWMEPHAKKPRSYMLLWE